MPEQDDNTLEQKIEEVMLELMAVLWSNGFKEASVGALMRLMGVDEEDAAEHYNDVVLLDEHFADVAAEMANKHKKNFTVPPGTTVH